MRERTLLFLYGGIMEYSANVFEATNKLLESGASRFFSLAKQPDTYSGIVWPLEEDKYLFVYPNMARVMYVDREMKPLAAKVSGADRWIVSHAMDAYTRKSASIFEPTGWLDEMTCNRRYAMVYYLKKVLEIGTDKLKLYNSKIIDDYFFFCVEIDLYFVFRLNADKDDFEVFMADLPEVAALEPKGGIFVQAENVVIMRLKSWVEEAEAGKE